MTTSVRDDVVIVPYEVSFEFFPRISGWEGRLPPSQFAFLREAGKQMVWKGLRAAGCLGAPVPYMGIKGIGSRIERVYGRKA